MSAVALPVNSPEHGQLMQLLSPLVRLPSFIVAFRCTAQASSDVVCDDCAGTAYCTMYGAVL